MGYDAIIIGGSYAGLSAALQLARARRRVLVADAGRRRNRFARSSHGFLTQDGQKPEDVAALGKAQVVAYPTVEWADVEARSARVTENGFSVELGPDRRIEARRLILATGVTDELPATPGLAERWGASVFHCPYCHGYELGAGPIGVLATSEMAMHYAVMLPDWGETILFLNDAFAPDAEQSKELRRRSVRVVPGRVARIEGHADVVLADGTTVAVAGIFAATRTRPSTPIADDIGCAFEDGPMGRVLKTDAFKAASVPGVFACGDLARPMHSVALAVADGALAGVGAHRSILFGLG